MKAISITPTFYYEWGNEPKGYVSTGCYINDVFKSTGYMLYSDALRLGLKYHCPHS